MDHSRILVFEGLQEFVDNSLKSGGCVALSKVHYFGLPMSFRGAKGGLSFIALTNTNVVVSGPDVELGE